MKVDSGSYLEKVPEEIGTFWSKGRNWNGPRTLVAWPGLRNERVGGGETMDITEKKQSQVRAPVTGLCWCSSVLVFSRERIQSRDSILCKYRVVRSLLVMTHTLQDVERTNPRRGKASLYIVWRLLCLWVELPLLSLLLLSFFPTEMPSPPFWFSM